MDDPLFYVRFYIKGEWQINQYGIADYDRARDNALEVGQFDYVECSQVVDSEGDVVFSYQFADSASKVKIRRLYADAQLPLRQTPDCVGFDLHARTSLPVQLLPGQRISFPTGIALELPADIEGQVRSRSGLAAKHGIVVLNSPGTIDPDYRGEIIVCLANLGQTTYAVEPGDRIAQLVFAPFIVPAIQISEERSAPTARGTDGFGSTGK